MVVAFALGCAAEDPVRVSDECVAVTEPTLLPTAGGVAGRWSLGLVDGHVLFAYTALSSDGQVASAHAQWLTSDFDAESAEFWLGDSDALVPFEWVSHDGRLWAQIWAEIDGGARPVRETVAIYALSPGSSTPDRMARPMPANSGLDGLGATPIDVGGGGGISAGNDVRAPVTVAFGGPVFALAGIPTYCPAYINYSRLFVFTATDVEVAGSPDVPCVGDGTTWEHDMRLVPLRDGGAGVFFRLGTGAGQGFVHYSRIGPDLRLVDTPPHRVDFTTRASPIPGGFQPQAVALGDGTLLYTLHNAQSDSSECQDLMLVAPDGTGAHAAPFQMRCQPPPDGLRRGLNGPTLSAWVVLQPLASGHAVIAYGERTNYSPPGTEFVRAITASTEWEDGVFLHTIDERGRRASEILRVSAPETTGLLGPTTPRTATTGPYPGELEVQAISEGDDVVVAWFDRRPDAPGYYARRYHCGALAD